MKSKLLSEHEHKVAEKGKDDQDADAALLLHE